MAEGTFPKSDGDVLYASEANTMWNNSNKLKDLTPTQTGDWSTAPTTMTNITDEDLTTHSDGVANGTGTGGNAYLQIDLGQTTYFTKISYKFTLANTGVAQTPDVRIQVSTDDSNWFDIKTFTEDATYEGSLTGDLATIKARYIRFNLVVAPGGAGDKTLTMYHLGLQ